MHRQRSHLAAIALLTIWMTDRERWFPLRKYLLPHLGWIAARAPIAKIGETKKQFVGFVRPTQKNCPDCPKWGQEDFVPTNPDLADILGRTDLDFETFHFFDFLDPKFLDLQVPRSQNSQIPGFSGSHPALWIVGALSPTYHRWVSSLCWGFPFWRSMFAES